MLSSSVFKAMPAPRRPKAPGHKSDPRAMRRFASRLREAFARDLVDWVEVQRALDRHDTERALDLIAPADGETIRSWQERFVSALGDTYIDAANAELKRVGAKMRIELYEKAKRKKIPRSKNRFPGVPHSDEFIRGRAASLVVRVSREQRDAIREAIVARYNQTRRPETLVRDLKRTVGLDPRRGRALRSFENKLVERALRSFENDGVRRSVAAQVDRYREQLLQNRAETIARTESVSVENAARVEAWDIAVSAGEMPIDAEQEWVTTGDPCPFCDEMDGQRVSVGEEFVSTRYGNIPYPPLHPNCYCVVVLRSFR